MNRDYYYYHYYYLFWESNLQLCNCHAVVMPLSCNPGPSRHYLFKCVNNLYVIVNQILLKSFNRLKYWKICQRVFEMVNSNANTLKLIMCSESSLLNPEQIPHYQLVTCKWVEEQKCKSHLISNLLFSLLSKGHLPTCVHQKHSASKKGQYSLTRQQ